MNAWKDLFFRLAELIKSEVVKDRNDNHDPNNGQFTSNGGSNYNTKVYVDNQTKTQYNNLLRGTKASDGQEVKSVSGHAVGRMKQRNITPKQVQSVLASKSNKISPGKTKSTKCYEENKIRVVMNEKTGNIVSVMRRGRNGRKS